MKDNGLDLAGRAGEVCEQSAQIHVRKERNDGH